MRATLKREAAGGLARRAREPVSASRRRDLSGIRFSLRDGLGLPEFYKARSICKRRDAAVHD